MIWSPNEERNRALADRGYLIENGRIVGSGRAADLAGDLAVQRAWLGGRGGMGMLDGRICIVTGAAGSLGRASALRFVAEGAKVMLVDRDRPRLDAILKSLPEGRATAMLADVTNARATQAYVDATVAPWDAHYRMYSYVLEDLPAVIAATPVPGFPSLAQDLVNLTANATLGAAAQGRSLSDENALFRSTHQKVRKNPTSSDRNIFF